ncbi:hypothetical protein [Arachidicoccus soli]|nr:hypothetical protein [Arachidicoccus soli]
MFKSSLEFSTPDTLDEDRLVIAALEELWVMLEKKRDEKKYKAKMKYKITLTPVMGFALRVAFSFEVVKLITLDYTSNLLLDICNKVDKAYTY